MLLQTLLSTLLRYCIILYIHTTFPTVAYGNCDIHAIFGVRSQIKVSESLHRSPEHQYLVPLHMCVPSYLMRRVL